MRGDDAEAAALGAQALAGSAVVGRSGWRLCRRHPGALAVAFVAGVPAALALLMGREWHAPREPLAPWAHLLAGSVWLAAIEAAPVGYLLWRLGQRPLAWAQARDEDEADACR